MNEAEAQEYTESPAQIFAGSRRQIANDQQVNRLAHIIRDHGRK